MFKVGGGLRLYGEYGGPSAWGRARRLEGLSDGCLDGVLEQEELVCVRGLDKVGGAGVAACGVRCCAMRSEESSAGRGKRAKLVALRTAARLESLFFFQ